MTVLSQSSALAELNDLAVSEVRAIAEIAICMLRVNDLELQRGFAAMLVDESRHARSLIEAVEMLGGTVTAKLPSDVPVFKDVGASMSLESIARFLGRIAHVESELPALMRRVVGEIRDPELADDVRRRLGYVSRDEERHRVWATDQIERLRRHDTTGVVQVAIDGIDRSPIVGNWVYASCR